MSSVQDFVEIAVGVEQALSVLLFYADCAKLRVIVNEFHQNLKKTTSSVLSVF